MTRLETKEAFRELLTNYTLIQQRVAQQFPYLTPAKQEKVTGKVNAPPAKAGGFYSPKLKPCIPRVRSTIYTVLLIVKGRLGKKKRAFICHLKETAFPPASIMTASLHLQKSNHANT